VKFDQGAQMLVYGTLNADGAPGDSILFTRRDETDEWNGLSFHSASIATLQYCTIEYATNYSGAAIWANGAFPSIENCTIRYCDYGIYGENLTSPTLSVDNTIQENNLPGIVFEQCTNPSVSNQTVTGHGADHGAIYMYNTGEFHIGSGNNVTGNSWGLVMDPRSYPDAASSGNIPTAGNTNDDGIGVTGGTVYGAVTWRDVATDYILAGSPQIGGTASLTIDDGVTVKADHGQQLIIYGTLTAIGSPGDGILFTRRDETDETGGLSFGSGSAGTLQYCTIEYATRHNGSAITVNNGSLDLGQCTLHHSDYGISVTDAAPHIINCQITGNSEYGVHLSGASVPTFGASLAEWNDIYGNGGGQPDRDLWNGTADITANYVYWGTLAEAQIQDKIHHEPDNPSLGRVNFSPWTNAAHDSAYTGGGSAVDEAAAIPEVFQLAQNHPNPASSGIEIRYGLPKDCCVRLEVFDTAGRKVATLLHGSESAGYKTFHWDTRDMDSGVYFYRLEAGQFTETKRLILLR
jgi:hypothetical protein